MILEEVIFQHSKSCPEKIAIISGNQSVTYGELWLRIKQAASFLKSSGFQKGDRIILSASKHIEFIYTYFGAHLCGLICIPIDPETNELRLKRILTSAKPSIIVGDFKNTGNYQVSSFQDVVEYPKDSIIDFQFPKENDIADLLFTTGTTGLPKGVMLSYLNIISTVKHINTFIGNTAEDIELLALPISHSFGLGRLRCVLYEGATLVLLGSFASMKKFYGAIEEYKVTGFGMVPTSWAYLKKMSANKIGTYAQQINYIEIGSAFMSSEAKNELMQLLPQTRICMHYGLTEASRSAFINFHQDRAHLDSVGKPSPFTEIEIFDEEGNMLPSNTEGELCVKGPHVCVGYWQQSKEEFLRDFNQSYFRTGDWGYIDADGYIHLKSRLKEIINVGGKKVSPIEVEEVLNTIPGIQESACIGVPDDVMGEVVKAFVVGSLSESEDSNIKRTLQKVLENYKVPVYIEHIEKIPRTSSGKIQRLLLV